MMKSRGVRGKESFFPTSLIKRSETFSDMYRISRWQSLVLILLGSQGSQKGGIKVVNPHFLLPKRIKSVKKGADDET
jgi:hypothetical protein